MCGIAGIWHLHAKPLSKQSLVTFTDSLAHRGPDGAGYFIDQQVSVGLGHRRLSILDVSERGAQPMSDRFGRYTITYNGEVFNFLELRKELENLGYVFSSDTDTEVIIAAYDAWGKDCLLKFNGMWAFAIWDNRKKSLFLARDRFGVKPLHYAHIPGKLFAFASETASFQKLDGFERRSDDALLAATIHNTFSLEGIGYTIFQYINQILPGHYMEVGQKSDLIQKRWWSTAAHMQEVIAGYDEQVDHFKEIFFDACRLRLRSDVPIASALSGGLDSSSVYCVLHSIMAHQDKEIRTPQEWRTAFSAVFAGTMLDESQYARQVINHVGGALEIVEPRYDQLVEQIVTSVKQYDCVYITPLMVLGSVYEAMSMKQMKVSLDGHGVDEMLYGYPHLVQEAFYSAYDEGDEEYAEDLLTTFAALFPESEQNTHHAELKRKANIKGRVLRQVKRQAPHFVRNTVRQLTQKKYSWVTGYPGLHHLPVLGEKDRVPANSAAERVLYESFHTTTLPTILRNFDRASMRHGVEVRMPFMDWRLVSYIFSLPMKSKVGQGYSKRILRDSMRGVVPESVRVRTGKIGFNAPLIEWFRGPLREFILDEVGSQAFLQSSLWRGEEIKIFTERKMKEGSWQWDDCIKLWPYINAHLIKNK